MRSFDSILDEVREIVTDVLALEPDEVKPSSRFFADLGGESIDVLELSFQCKKRFNVKTPFQQMAGPGGIGTSEDGHLSEAALVEFKERYPFLNYAKIGSEPSQEQMTDLFTVEAIAHLIDRELSAS